MSGLPFDLGDGAFVRPYVIDDADELFRVVDAERGRLSEWLAWPPLTVTIEDERRWLASVVEDQVSLEGCGIWAGDDLAGGIGLRPGPFGISAEMGYWLSERFIGRGLVTRAARAFTDRAFDELGVHRVEIRAGVDNARSRAVPERLGFTAEGIDREAGKGAQGFYDLAVYAVLDREWRSLRSE